jgi:hypothetical protein
MPTYTVQPGCVVQGAQTPVTVVTFNPAPLLSATQPGQVSTYFYHGTTPSDVQLGGAAAVTKHQNSGAIK